VLYVSGEAEHPILLYDGVCGLCNRLVQFILRHDQKGNFQFAALQSRPAQRILSRHGAHAEDLDTVYVVLNFSPQDASGEVLFSRSEAVLLVLKELGGSWRVIGLLLQLLPRFIRDWGYRQVARKRYRIFGRYDSCPLSSEGTRARFLDL
jgi:predicted DCC family thiol-disulfide oxidoreductase YuxK